MAGYNQDPLAIINLIADNLRDRYKSGFPVLKEIVQNADDAGSDTKAVQLDFGLSPGIPKAQHPLLRGPALFFINDGRFTDADNKAIHSFGLNSKAAEEGTIGKFGLGMKSVFHFCEAFFFLAKGKDDKGQVKEYAEILNPWSSGGDPARHLHADWDNDWDKFADADAVLMREHLKSALDLKSAKEWEARDTCFLLWLPLRRDVHLRRADGVGVGSIVESFPGDDPAQLDFLHAEDLPEHLAALMPLLRRMTQIRFWRDPAAPNPDFTLELHEKSTRISCDLQAASKDAPLRGVVVNTTAGGKSMTAFAGMEHLVKEPALLDLKMNPLWPKTYVRDELGQSKIAPDKATGHCAAVFSAGKADRGECVINWAVFLPVGDEHNDISPCGGSKVFHLTLHGYFFVDAGRADIEGFPRETLAELNERPADQTALRRLWNSHLARLGVLPLILPALASFVAQFEKSTQTRLSADDRWNLSQGLAASKTFQKYRSVICAEHAWVCRLTPQGREWRLIGAGQDLQVLPKPPAEPRRPWDTFANLSALEERGVVPVEKDAPHLVARSSFLPQRESMAEDEAKLLDLLRIDERNVFSRRPLLAYLVQFLTMEEVYVLTKMGTVQTRLREIFRDAFRAHGSHGLGQINNEVCNFVSCINRENRYPLNASDKVIRELQDVVTSNLLLNSEFESEDNKGEAKFSLDETSLLLQKLHDLIIKNVGVDECIEISWNLLQSISSDEWRNIQSRINDLKIFSGYDCNQQKKIALSVIDLEYSRNQSLLFRYSPGVRLDLQLNVAPILQAAIQERVLVVSSATLALVFGKDNPIVPCDAGAALAALGATPPLTLRDMDARQKLLQTAANAVLGTYTGQQRRGLRYLLHGLPEHFDDDDTLWVPDDGDNGVWGKIWAHLQKGAADRWTLLDRRLVGFIAQNNWPTLGLKPINIIGVLDELRTSGPQILQGIDLTRAECKTVLQAAANEQRLWQDLPLHETVDGRFVSIEDGRAYLKNETMPLPDALAASVDLIAPADDTTIRACQDRWIAPINPENILRIALNHNTPRQFCSLILEQLGNIEEGRFDMLIRLIPELLVNSRWLPDARDNAVRPEDVIDLPEMDDAVNRLVAEARGVYSSPENLAAAVRNHANFPRLRRLFSQNAQGMEKLALLLDETENYRIGELQLPDDAQALGAIARICRDLPAGAQLPGWGLLAQVLEHYPEHRNILIPSLRRDIAAAGIIRVLVELQKNHASAQQEAKQDTLECFHLYLAALATRKNRDYLAGLKLRNKQGRWRDSGELCVGAVGVADSHVLHDEQLKILADVIVSAHEPPQAAPQAVLAPEGDVRARLDRTKDELRSYFNQWRDDVAAEEIICAFLAVLGASLEELAQEFCGKRSIDWIRAQIPWTTPRHMAADGQQCWLYGVDRAEALAKFDFLVSISEGDGKVNVTSILGQTILVPKQGQFTSLIVGAPSYIPLNNDRYAIELTLRGKPQQASPVELSGYLRTAAEFLLRSVYAQKNVDLTPLWEELDKSDQLDIRVAQKRILESIPHLFSFQLSEVRKHPDLHDVFKEWEEAQHKADEFEGEPDEKTYRNEERKLLRKMQDLALNNTGVQEAMLAAVRAKMTEYYQYRPQRMPFELFQNADDAVVELLAMRCYPDPLPEDDADILPDSARRFVLQQTTDCLFFAHWGRWINEVGVGPFPGRERGFHRDLKKMLMLSASDKAEEKSVTGKFGLGFKSVFLVSARPVLISGRLAAEIVGGLCPKNLEDAQPYRDRLEDLSREADEKERRRGTLVALPLDPTLDANAPRDVTAEFVRRAGVLCIFAKRIRRIDLAGQASATLRWQPDARSCGGALLEWGEAALSGDPKERQAALYFRFAEGEGGLLFGMSAKGFCPLPEAVPGIWVVAPTEEASGLGLAINAAFDLNAGRTSLAGNNAGNVARAKGLGRRFGAALADLYAMDVSDLRKWLRLEGDLSPYDFWHSLWRVLTEALKHRSAGRDLAALVIAGEHGLGALLNQADALPNGLWGDFQRLTRPANIRKVVTGVLAEADFFLKICSWDFFIKEYLGEPAEVVSEHIIAQGKRLVPLFGRADFRYTPVNLAGVLHEFAGKQESRIHPETAALFGGALEGFVREGENIKEELKTFLFKTKKDGKFRKSEDLLMGESSSSARSEEEGRVAAFAPDDALLAPDYQDKALDFFKLCRDGFRAKIDAMANWFRDADTPERQSAALRYLLEGNQGDELAKVVREAKSGWLADLSRDSECFKGWHEEEIDEILLRYLLAHGELKPQSGEKDNEDEDEDQSYPQELPPQETLNKIYEWWLNEKDYWLDIYQKNVYPVLPCILEDNVSGSFDRSSWLMLFLLGHFQTMGRQQDFQHRDFIKLCIDKGWWSTFSLENPEKRAAEWMNILESYIDDQINTSQYEHWMNHFPIIYKLARYLYSYRESFLSIDRHKEISSIGGILMPRVNPDFQGGGIDAPPIYKTLGYGACFVIRELRRKGILTNHTADSFCYMPVSRVRELCSRLSCSHLEERGSINDSKIIYNFLCEHLGEERATFANCYDIPLLILAGNEPLFQGILNDNYDSLADFYDFP